MAKKKLFNPILNNPFAEPSRYYATLLDGSLDYENIMEGRRPFVPSIPAVPVKPEKHKPKDMFTIKDMPGVYESHLINLIRREVGEWRKQAYPHTTGVTRELLTFWFANAERTKPLFFAQQEAVETGVWLNEAAEKSNAGSHILNELQKSRSVSRNLPEFNLPRIAFKMATGTGKTVVMAMFILYHYFNRINYRRDDRFADRFLVIAPGITIRDRLQVLYPDMQRKGTGAGDYYHERGLVPGKYEKKDLPGLASRLIVINRHALERKTFKDNKRSPFDGKAGTDRDSALEDYTVMLRREIGELKKGSRVLILNDEAHHCYLPKKSGGDKENRRAAVWMTGLAEISKRCKIRAVYDLSATPYFLMGSGYTPYEMFPWVVSDFGLVEAMESGLVKIPFIPESDSTHELDMPVLRNLYDYVSRDLPRSISDKNSLPRHPQIPGLIVNALDQFYSHYVKHTAEFEENRKKQKSMFDTPPVFIIVCSNTTVSHEIFRYAAGYEMEEKDGSKRTVNGHLPLFDNFDQQGLPRRKPPSLLIDSEEIDNSGQITPQFKKIFDAEIRQFRENYRSRAGKSPENITDSDILREVVNTVGKPGKLGEHVRCVVSVSMLTEGWDTNTVTHIMGLRAFGSQLLCEQVVGRALRRVDYNRGKDGKYPPENAHVIGVPFPFFKKGGSPEPPEAGEIYVVTALEERKNLHEIVFPNISGYRIERENDCIHADFSHVKDFEIDGSRIPAQTKMGTAFSGESEIMTPEQAAGKRKQALVYHITRNLISLHFRDDDGNPKFQYFPVMKDIVHYWLENRVKCIGDAFVNLLFHFDEREYCNHIIQGIQAQSRKTDRILPVLHPYNNFGTTSDVHAVTRRKNRPWVTEKSHVNYVIADTGKWEQIAAKTLEEMEEVVSYVKNQFLDFAVPYVYKGIKDRLYYPDFIARCRSGNGEMLNLIIEISGMSQDKEDKKWYVENRWLPGVNSIREQYGFDRWAFIEISGDIRDIKNELREKIQGMSETCPDKTASRHKF